MNCAHQLFALLVLIVMHATFIDASDTAQRVKRYNPYAEMIREAEEADEEAEKRGIREYAQEATEPFKRGRAPMRFGKRFSFEDDEEKRGPAFRYGKRAGMRRVGRK